MNHPPRDYTHTRSYRCPECDGVRFIEPEDIPVGGLRCRNCGSAMAETDSSRAKRDAPRRRTRQTKEEATVAHTYRVCRPYRCPSCGERFRNRNALTLHFEDHERATT